MKTNIHITLAADVIRALRVDPRQSNNDLAQKFGVSEGFIRRYRAIYELAGELPAGDSRVGTDGVTRSLPTYV